MPGLYDSQSIDIIEINEDPFNNFYDILEKHINGETNIEDIIVPTTKIAASDWARQLLRIENENDFLSGEYKIKQIEKYIKPVTDRIERNNRIGEFIRIKLLDFLEDIKEQSINFPDIGTITAKKISDKIDYDSIEDSEDLAKKLYNDDETKQFVKVTYSLNKKAISDYFKNNGKIPQTLSPIDVKKDQGKGLSFRKFKND